MNTANPIRKIAERTLICFITILLCLILCELFLRKFFPQLKYDYPPGAFISNLERGYEYKPDYTGTIHSPDYEITFYIDKYGFRNYPNTQSSFTKTSVILGLGDSLTFGKGVRFEETYLSIISQSLNVPVINAAVDGYGLSEELLLLKDKIDLVNPSLILVGLTLENDFDDILRKKRVVQYGVLFEGEDVENLETKNIFVKTLDRIKMFFSLHSDLYHLFKKFVKSNKTFQNILIKLGALIKPREVDDIPLSHRILFSISDDKTNLALKKVDNIVSEFKNISDENKSNLLFVLLPSIVQYNRKLVLSYYNRELCYHIPDTLISIFQKHNVPYLDLSPFFREAFNNDIQFTFQTDKHWNQKGHQIAGEAISLFINQNYSYLVR
ncbi:MAG: hypothetical protein AB1765_09755 [Candidatus Hydrogenedentota bacterium]